ncbi:hypothetical protein AAGQ96_01880 [Pantoea sp. MBD-2R]|uniref:hypothetical protein n=1 Tax=unclassified Pantoea TaxID=2630326 RepID=UPI0011BF393F|nr:hypothetical protein [Pantoea sp. CCBC3-3-1]
MRNIHKNEMEVVAGGSLTSDILDYFKGSDSSENNKDWTSPSTVVSPAIGQGDKFGKVVVGALVIAATIFSAGLNGVFGLMTRK